MRVNLFIIGVNKAGSSWLHYLLDSHPDIYMSKVKEHNYFGKIYPSNIEEYHKYFPFEKPFIYFGESTPSYFFSEKIAQEIFEYCPNAKIIAIVRDPIKRLISHYNFRKQLGAFSEQTSIEKAISEADPHLIADSHYEKTLPFYQQIFGSDNFKIVSLEESWEQPDKFWDNLLEFLSVKNYAFPENQNKPENPTGSKPFRLIYRLSIIPIKKHAPHLYRFLLQMKFMHWSKTILLKLFGTVQPTKLSPKLSKKLNEEFQPTYEYLNTLGLGYHYNQNK